MVQAADRWGTRAAGSVVDQLRAPKDLGLGSDLYKLSGIGTSKDGHFIKNTPV